MDSLIFIQKKEYTDSSSSSMPVQAAKEEKKRLLGLAWLGLLRISLFFSLSSFFSLLPLPDIERKSRNR
jgi:hypothetical protein